MKHIFIQITQVWPHYFKLFNRVQSTQDEKARFIKGNELKWTQGELFSFLFFKREYHDKIKNKTLNSQERVYKYDTLFASKI